MSRFVPFWLTPETGLTLAGGERRDLVFPRGPLKITGFSFAPSLTVSLVAESLSLAGREQLVVPDPIPLVVLAGGALSLDTIPAEGPLSYLRVRNTSPDPVRFMLRALAYEPV